MKAAEPGDHPAPFSKPLIPLFNQWLKPESGVLDPFAGIGGVHALRDFGHDTWGVELEAEWAAASEFTSRGTALNLAWPDASFDAIVTSPTYGNRMADHHDARDPSHRRTYRHYLGRHLSPNNSGAMQWGPEYRQFHALAWAEANRVLRPGGLFVFDCKDHVRDRQVQPVTAWHVNWWLARRFQLVAWQQVGVSGYRYGANRTRLPQFAIALRKPE